MEKERIDYKETKPTPLKISQAQDEDEEGYDIYPIG